MPLFAKSAIHLPCDRCGRTLSLSSGGVCTACRDMLCDAHLHGSLAQRLKVALFGAKAVCTQCRAEGRTAEIG